MKLNEKTKRILTLVAVAVLVVLFSIFIVKFFEAKNEVKNQEAEISSIKADISKMSSEINDYENILGGDKEAAESFKHSEAIKEGYGFPDETVIIDEGLGK